MRPVLYHYKWSFDLRVFLHRCHRIDEALLLLCLLKLLVPLDKALERDDLSCCLGHLAHLLLDSQLLMVDIVDNTA